jgi:uncharacterized protein YciI
MSDRASLEPAVYTVLLYDYVDEMVQRRAPFRDAHLGHVQTAKDRGELLNAGAIGDAESALFVFAPETVQAARAFVAGDPYVVNDLVPTWRLTTWNVVT